MATAKKHIAKDGKITYHLRASNGYDSNGKQIIYRTTWTPKPNMSERAIKKELKHQKILFDDKVKANRIFDTESTFREYSQIWLTNNKANFAPKTYERYSGLLQTIYLAIGDIKLINLKPQHLQSFYNNLREEGINRKNDFAVTSIDLSEKIKAMGLSREGFAKESGIGITTIRKACHTNKHISISSAEAIAQALKIPISKVFQIYHSNKGYSEKTILHYHRLIGIILRQATREGLISRNIAGRDYIKAPKVPHKEAAFLDDKQAAEVISLLAKEPIKWKTAVMLLIYSGMRRGELFGLEWKDIDFENKVIHIVRSSQFVAKMGIITKETKTISSERTLTLPPAAFEILSEYKKYCNNLKLQAKNNWNHKITITLANGKKVTVDNDRLFTKNNGMPMNPDSLTSWIKKFREKNNLPIFTPHSLRHTNASLLIANGINIPTVSKRLGHASISTTTKIYSHAIQSSDEKALNILAEKLDPLSHQ